MEPRFIVVGSDRDSSEFVRFSLMSGGFNAVHVEEDTQRAAALLESQPPFDIAVILLGLEGAGAEELLDAIQLASPATESIVIAAGEDMPAAFQCLRRGAYDYLSKPFAQQRLLFVVRRALEHRLLLDVLECERSVRPAALANPAAFAHIITCSERLLRVLKAAELLSASDAPVLITGESGTGKTLLAKAIHGASRRAGQPFLPVDPSGLSMGHFEDTLLVTAADSAPAGELKREDHLNSPQATLFLRDIADLPIAVQGKLLDMIRNGDFLPPEGGAPPESDVRVVAATNQDLEFMLRSGRFRKDLFGRFRGAWLNIPPLKERPEDIAALSDHFLTQWGAPGKRWRLESPAAAALRAYEFPGNVRELQEVIRKAVERARGRVISVECLPEEVRRSGSAMAEGLPHGSPALPLAEVEKQYVLNVYRQMSQNKVRTARTLGIGLNTVRRKLKGYGTP